MNLSYLRVVQQRVAFGAGGSRREGRSEATFPLPYAPTLPWPNPGRCGSDSGGSWGSGSRKRLLRHSRASFSRRTGGRAAHDERDLKARVILLVKRNNNRFQTAALVVGSAIVASRNDKPGTPIATAVGTQPPSAELHVRWKAAVTLICDG